VPQAEAQLHWGGAGLAATWQVQLEDGSLRGEIHSEELGRLQLPEQGRFSLAWQGLPLKPLQPLLPEGIFLEGALFGSMAGDWSPDGTFQVRGRGQVNEGIVRWQRAGGLVSAPLRSAEVDWDWTGEALRGSARIALLEHGRADGNFRLPLAARFPLEWPPEGPLQGALTADLQEEGLLTAFFPGLVQETRGRVEAGLQVSGSWAQPEVAGRLRLSEAGAYLPAGGIRLQDILLEVQLAGEEVLIETLQVQSGPGQLHGEGSLRLRDGALESFRGTLRGERFQTVNLPELRILASPDLQIEGDRQRLTVHGEVRLPELLVFGRDTSPPVEVSRDVIIVDAPEDDVRDLPMALDLQVRLLLGDRVLVQTQGIDARLQGSVLVRAHGLDQITGQGEINVAQGTYAALGLKLRIDRGVLLFAGGPIDQPTLDILAVRPIGEVRAGVQVTGTPRQPVVVLYSDPAMPDTDILSYIVLGRPLGEGGEEVGLLMLAAGTLLSKGESVVLQDRVRRRLGVDVLVIDPGDGDIAESRITVGKYLSPELYISFGQSLFTNIQEVRLRYSITDQWQLESAVGVESSVDLYYQIEFR
jgi:translocation and assembly module TamB